MTTAEEHEAFALFPAYCTLVTYLLPETEVLEASPGDLVGVLCWESEKVSACLIVAHCSWVTEDTDEAAGIVREIWAMCVRGERPQYLAEMGMTVEDAFGGTGDER